MQIRARLFFSPFAVASAKNAVLPSRLISMRAWVWSRLNAAAVRSNRVRTERNAFSTNASRSASVIVFGTRGTGSGGFRRCFGFAAFGGVPADVPERRVVGLGLAAVFRGVVFFGVLAFRFGRWLLRMARASAVRCSRIRRSNSPTVSYSRARLFLKTFFLNAWTALYWFS